MNIDEILKEKFESKKYGEVIREAERYLKETKEKLGEQSLGYYLRSLSYYGIYDREIKYLRIKTPKPYKSTKDYQNNIKIIKRILANDEISESILFDFYVSLIKVGEFENAYKILNNIKKLYPQYIDNFMLVIMLLRCNKVNEAKELIEEADFNGNQLMKIGITYFTIGQYELSKNTLEKAREEGFSSYFDDIYEKIYYLSEEHLETNKYVSMSYEYFKVNNELKPGDIIFVSDVDDYYKSIDSSALNRTYMIWKIEGEKISAFPVTNKIPKDIRRFRLFRQNYLNFDSDRSVKEDLVIINKKDVEKVQERLTQEDFSNVLGNIYSGIIVQGDKDKYQMVEPFMAEMYNNFQIEKNDVIVAYNRDEKRAKNYLVVDQDEDYLYCIELVVAKVNAIPAHYEIKKIDKKKELLRINKSIKVNNRYIEEIDSMKPQYRKTRETRNI